MQGPLSVGAARLAVGQVWGGTLAAITLGSLSQAHKVGSEFQKKRATQGVSCEEMGNCLSPLPQTCQQPTPTTTPGQGGSHREVLDRSEKGAHLPDPTTQDS